MKKIAQIVPVYPPYKSGIGTSAYNFARLFKLSGNIIKTFTISNKEKTQEEDVEYLTACPRYGNAGFLGQLIWKLKDFDIIYLNYPFFGTAELIWFLKKFIWGNKKKLIIHYHMDFAPSNFFSQVFSLSDRLIFNSLFKSADLIISGSLDYIKNGRLAEFYKKYSDKFLEIPYGVETDKFFPVEKIVDEKNIKFIFVGGLDRPHYFKGVNILLEAMARLSDERDNFSLNIIGSGDLAEEYKLKAVSLNISDKVNFFEKVNKEELPLKYREADVLVLPSINKGEAFGIVLIEALASGLAVIASNLPGVRSVFESDQQGLLCIPGDVNDLKEKLRFFIDNHNELARMKKNARSLALEKYDWNKIGDKLKLEVDKKLYENNFNK